MVSARAQTAGLFAHLCSEGRIASESRRYLGGVYGGEFCLLQPGTYHTLEGITDTITPFSHMDVFYHPQRKDSFPTRPGQLDLTPFAHLMQPRLNDLKGVHIPCRFVPSDPFRFRDTLLRMIDRWNQHDTLSRLEAQSLATELVVMLLQDHTEQQGISGESDASLKWMTSYLHLHLSEPLTTRQMAARANLSPSRFRAVFQERFGMPPHQYLTQLRLRHARDLLKQTDYKLHQIADYCGFADAHHFAKTFKKETGQAPGAYRREHRTKTIF
ncbi:helix-turn-helix domain-containing protein [Paenibacillus sp. MBLB4367]|uniref:helix-turn-helix domain-containing protein n=1 Tax=Paenibacillus sp. MBLB4367 TaxID=3384767 RepID=UPI00390831C4